jgi:hypothetical protein
MSTQNFRHGPTQIGFKLSGWKAVAALGLLLAALAGIVVFALSLLIVLAPIILVASAACYFLGGKRRYAVASRNDTSAGVIDGEFRVVEKPDNDVSHGNIQIGPNSK